MQTKQRINTKWFRAQLAEREMSMRGLAKKLSLDPASVSLMLRGMRKMTNVEAHAIASIFGVPMTEVLRQAGVPVTDDVHTVALTGVVDGSARVRSIASKARQQVPPDVPGDGFALQVRCPTSTTDGWLIVCAPTVVEPQAALERLAVLHLENGDRVMGTLRKGYEPGLFNVVATFPAPVSAENQSITGANLVLWIRPQ
jgi:DNA-binding transcriptional regulator YdaS (Cro superfamily)